MNFFLKKNNILLLKKLSRNEHIDYYFFFCLKKLSISVTFEVVNFNTQKKSRFTICT